MNEFDKFDPKNFYADYYSDQPKRLKKMFAKKWGFGEDFQEGVIADVSSAVAEWVGGTKKYPEKNIYTVKTENVVPFAKRLRSRKTFQKSWWLDEKTGQPISGKEKYDYLIESLKKHGWHYSQPLVVSIGKKGRATVVNGHHRLSIALELGLKEIPICFLYKG